MRFCGCNSLSIEDRLKIAEDNLNAQDHVKAAAALAQVEKKGKRALNDPELKELKDRIARAYHNLGNLQKREGRPEREVEESRRLAQQWGYRRNEESDMTVFDPQFNNDQPPRRDSDAAIVGQLFTGKSYLLIEFNPPGVGERLHNIPQLAYSLALLQVARSPSDILVPTARQWFEIAKKNPAEQERLKSLAAGVVAAYKSTKLKDAEVMAEVLYLAPVLENDAFQILLREFFHEVEKSSLLNITQLEGLAQLIQSAKPGQLGADDLNNILELLNTRLRKTHKQSPTSIYKLMLAVSCVLDAMADAKIEGIDRVTVHEPLSQYLKELKEDSDSYLVYQAAYAHQALLRVPDNETTWQAAMRRTGKVIQGVAGVVSAVKGVDLNKFIDGLADIQEGLIGAAKAVKLAKDAYDNVVSLKESGNNLLDSLEEGLSFDRKGDWYSVLRGADALIRGEALATFRKLVCDASCRTHPAFQWGVCQRLGEIAANPLWDSTTRREAIGFLGEIYRNDALWGQLVNVKQWILNILVQLSSLPGSEMTAAKELLHELKKDGDVGKRALYQKSVAAGSGPYTLKVSPLEPTSSVLLNLAWERYGVEGMIGELRSHRLEELNCPVFVQPHAKANSGPDDNTERPLMDMAVEFLGSNRKVFLLIGDSGAGKSTFSRKLESELWAKYKPTTGPIPLHIHLPTFDKPEHDMITKHLRKLDFRDHQIKELKTQRKFILICDGYDESQQTHNLYTSNRLSQPGEWRAQMIVTCHSNYLGADYRDRFQPGSHNQPSSSSLLQEAVIMPFTSDQVQDYVNGYLTIHKPPRWQAEDYCQALEHFPGLNELVKNPFLLALSVKVLPGLMKLGQHTSTARVTRVEFMGQEGFTHFAREFLRTLSVAIFRNQNGVPDVTYTHSKDKKTWKADFFGLEAGTRLLLEACPLTRSGELYQFIHPSLLDYGLTLAIFDPQDGKNSKVHRDSSASDVKEPDPESPLVWRDFSNDPLILQFLEERAKLMSVQRQLLSYVNLLKADEKWLTAALNAKAILEKVGVHVSIIMPLQNTQQHPIAGFHEMPGPTQVRDENVDQRRAQNTTSHHDRPVTPNQGEQIPAGMGMV
ncbi:hypothetical protein BGX34_011288 [Mortierella sp. NVP85]|nr:hypothetical protein BGX34_011288 [Mortierella sp. NVP85]